MTSRFALAFSLVFAFAAGCSSPPIEPSPPVLEVGTGDGEFAALGPGVTVPINYGPQGGEHIWFAARCRGFGPNVALTYSIVDDQGHEVSGAQQAVIPDDLDDEGWRVVTSLTAFIDDVPEGAPVDDGTHLVFHGHAVDAQGHASDATGKAVVKGSN